MNNFIPESELIINADGSIYHLCLKPENLASLIFTVGDPERVGLVSQYFDQIDFQAANREFVTHTGRLNGRRVTVMSTGMGTDNIEILMTELDALVNVDFETRTIKEQKSVLDIIRLGTSGSMQNDLEVGTLLAADKAIGLDTLMQFYPTLSGNQEFAQLVQKTLEISFTPYQAAASHMLMDQLPVDFQKGITLTAPGFYAPQGRQVRIKPKMNQLIERLAMLEYNGQKLTNFEMETAGYYAMGELLGHRMLSLNAIVVNRPAKQMDKEAGKTVDRLIQTALAAFCVEQR